MPRMALAEFRLWGGHVDQPYALLCKFCGDQTAAFGPGDAEEAVQMTIDHYVKGHPGLLLEEE